MPSVPIPQQVPIERAGWNTDFSGNVQMPNSDRSPVNPIMSGLSQAGQQAQTALQGIQAGQGVQDIQMKQKGMQASMLGALANLSPDQFESQKATTIGLINKLNPSQQYDPNIDQQTARMAAMSMVPVTEQPNYAMNQSNAAINMALLKALGGAPAAAAGMGGEAPGNAPAAQPSAIGGQVPPAQPGGMMTPQAEALLAIARPEASKALQGTPIYKEQVAASETQGKNTAEAQKNALQANEGYQQVKQSIDSLKSLIGTTDEKGNFVPNPDLPQLTDVRSTKTQAELSQRFPLIDNQKAANAYNTFETINESQTINAIRSLADTGQIRMTKTLENIINRGYLIDPDASPQAKMQQAVAVENELENSAISAQNVSSKLSGGQGNTPYKAPYIAPTAAAQQAQSALGNRNNQQQGTPIIKSPNDPAFANLPKGAKFVGSDGILRTKL